MATKKKLILNPIIIIGIAMIGMLIIILVLINQRVSLSLKTQIPPFGKTCGPQKSLEEVGTWEGKSTWTGRRPNLQIQAEMWRRAIAYGEEQAPYECDMRSKELPLIDFPACPTPKPEPIDYVCLENEDEPTSCTVATSYDLRTAQPPINRRPVQCLKDPRRIQPTSSNTWTATVKCTAVCVCQRSCVYKEKEQKPIDI